MLLEWLLFGALIALILVGSYFYRLVGSDSGLLKVFPAEKLGIVIVLGLVVLIAMAGIWWRWLP